MELEELFKTQTDCHNLIVDLKEIELVDREAVTFLALGERKGIELRNCPAYLREWVPQELLRMAERPPTTP